MRLLRDFRSAALALLTGALLVGGSAAKAHPHVWVTATSELVYAADGSITGMRHTWTFDDMLSSHALQGIETKTKGVYTREELQPLAQIKIEALKEHAYFTSLKANGKLAFEAPTDYFLDYTDDRLTLHFTLPLKTPVKSKRLLLEIVDPSYFIDFQMAKDHPVKLVGAPRRLRGVARSANGRRPGPQDGTRCERGILRGGRRERQYRPAIREQDRGGMPMMPLVRTRRCL